MKLGALPERLMRADTVIHLDLPTPSCLTGIARRRLRHRGRMRPDLGVYDPITWPFVQWVCTFRRRQRPRLVEALGAFDGETIVIRRRRDVAGLLAALTPAEATQSRTPLHRVRTAPRRDGSG